MVLNKAAVVIDGFLSSAADRLPVPDTGSVFDDILMHATNLSRFLISREGKIITEIIGEGQMDSGLAEAYRTRYFQPRRLEARLLMERGVQRGELKDNLDIEVVTDLIYGLDILPLAGDLPTHRRCLCAAVGEIRF